MAFIFDVPESLVLGALGSGMIGPAMSLAAGSTLGPYTIRAELGHGGMGVVYTAQDPRLDRQVAIKVLPPELTRDETAKQRFLQEAKACRPPPCRLRRER